MNTVTYFIHKFHMKIQRHRLSDIPQNTILSNMSQLEASLPHWINLNTNANADPKQTLMENPKHWLEFQLDCRNTIYEFPSFLTLKECTTQYNTIQYNTMQCQIISLGPEGKTLNGETLNIRRNRSRLDCGTTVKGFLRFPNIYCPMQCNVK